MGKKAHGRLLSEIRTTLIGTGFFPKRVTLLDAEPGERQRAVYSDGFTLAKYRERKSISLAYWVNPQEVWNSGGRVNSGQRARKLAQATQVSGRARQRRLRSRLLPLRQPARAFLFVETGDAGGYSLGHPHSADT